VHNSETRRTRDSGMTLIELLVSVMLIGAIVTVLAAAVTVVFRQDADTQARLDVARWEQSLAMWLPADLTSASDVNVDPAIPAAAGCTTADCTFGSNALQLTWNDGSGTVVSYRYGPDGDGSSFMLTRVECSGGSCSSQVVLRDLAPPPPPWTAGDAVPTSVIEVTVPLVVDSSETEDTGAPPQSRRVIVSINGVPSADGLDRSSTVSFTAGGTSRGDLPTPSFSGPSFLEAATGCGGPVTLIVDRSNSINFVAGAEANIRAGVRSFIRAFEGTPTRLQIVMFGGESSVLGAGSGWNRFFDLAEPADVTELLGPTGNSGLVSGIVPFPGTTFRGGTNWEDALYRTFFTADGQTYAEAANPLAPAAGLVVFFTDGVPTYDRLQFRASPGAAAAAVTLPTQYQGVVAGTAFSPRAWYRADKIVDQFRNPDVRIIGVGVGAASSGSTNVPFTGWPWFSIPNEVFIGRLISGTSDPHTYTSSGPRGYTRVRYDGGWGDVSTADLLLTDNFNQFGSALTQIALAECGGTFTVQSRTPSNEPADAEITYQVDGRTVTTSRISKAASATIDLSGIAARDIQVVPVDLDSSGYAADSWSCRAGGADHPFALIQAGNPAAGIEVEVRANAAVSCTLRVTP
jgi:prepilin-type N-terminal cleavage/methylation domain-containing protein